MAVQNYRELIVWQKSMQLVGSVYKLIEKLPREEAWGLSSQIKRAAVSIPSNIAEGSRRGSRQDYKRFLQMAYGSGAEIETQVEIAKQLSFVNSKDCQTSEKLLNEIMKMLNSLIKKLS